MRIKREFYKKVKIKSAYIAIKPLKAMIENKNKTIEEQYQKLTFGLSRNGIGFN